MAARQGINPLQTSVLRSWFERSIKACDGDPQVYDFNAELDRTLTYAENKAKFDRIVTDLCGPKAGKIRDTQRFEKYMQAGAKAAYDACMQETSDCDYCDRVFYTGQFKIPAQQMKKGHVQACHREAEPVVAAQPPQEYDVYEEEY